MLYPLLLGLSPGWSTTHWRNIALPSSFRTLSFSTHGSTVLLKTSPSPRQERVGRTLRKNRRQLVASVLTISSERRTGRYLQIG